MIQKLLVPVAAFLVTVTGASAFTGGAWLSNMSADDLGITDAQKSALEEAQTVREEAREKADQILVNAGLDAETMRGVHEAMRGAWETHHEAVESALEDGDYSAFQKAIEGTPMADIIDTEEKFQKLAEAHELMEDGDRDGAREIRDELGLNQGRGFGGRGMGMMGDGEGFGRGRGMGDGFGPGRGVGRGQGQ